MDVSTRAVATAVLATAVAAAAFLGELPLAGAAVVLVLLLAVGWPVLLRLPSPLGSGVVVALTGIGGVAVALATRGEPYLRGLPIVIALAVLLAFVNELARQDGRLRLVESVTGTVSGVVVVATAAAWVAAARTPGGTGLVVTAAVALAIAAGVSAVPLGGWTGAFVTAGAAILAGGAVALVMPTLDPLPGVVLGLAVGILVASMHELLERTEARRRRLAAVAAIVLPVLVTGIGAYVVGRLMVG